MPTRCPKPHGSALAFGHRDEDTDLPEKTKPLEVALQARPRLRPPRANEDCGSAVDSCDRRRHQWRRAATAAPEIGTVQPDRARDATALLGKHDLA